MKEIIVTVPEIKDFPIKGFFLILLGIFLGFGSGYYYGQIHNTDVRVVSTAFSNKISDLVKQLPTDTQKTFLSILETDYDATTEQEYREFIKRQLFDKKVELTQDWKNKLNKIAIESEKNTFEIYETIKEELIKCKSQSGKDSSTTDGVLILNIEMPKRYWNVARIARYTVHHRTVG